MGNPEKEREANKSAPSTSEPPPPYTETAQGINEDGGDDDFIPPYIHPVLPEGASSATLLFPPSMTVVHSISLTTAHLGVNSKDKRYHITAKSSEFTLRSGPKKDSPTLAKVLNSQGGKFGKSSIQVPREKGETISLIMESDHSNRQPFSLRVGSDNHLEHFEWRQSQGNEIETIGQTTWHGYGWKLVRLTTPASLTTDGGKRSERDFGFTSDGKEILAAAAFTNKFWRGPNFSFMGTGLTGTLGEVFEIVTTITFLRVVWLQLQRSAHGGAPWWYNYEEHPGLKAEREASEAGPSGSK